MLAARDLLLIDDQNDGWSRVIVACNKGAWKLPGNLLQNLRFSGKITLQEAILY